MQLESLPKRQNKRQAKRIGRGTGSGVGGHTVGRGTKGQKSRSGHKSTLFFEGGNVGFFRRVPKYRGFNRTLKVPFQPVNIATLEKSFKANEEVTVEVLKEKNIIRKRTNQVKVLGFGELTKKLSLKGLVVSESARVKIEKAGGTIQ
ncbi:MAG TPA: 50S ribosomal protein L15 [Candidatus Dojkabacteria bacterium]|nr:50S ribosomal protein L15 [Candidatus Dojkabacteria bacterium]